jgi:hypothetical protein
MLLRQLTIIQDVSKHHLLTLSSMGSFRSKRLMPWATGALVLLSVHGLGAQRLAWAGCNHLVASRFDSFPRFDQLDELIQGKSVAGSFDERTQGSQEPNPNHPCSGMSCSSGVPLPVSTTSQGPESSDQWGALAGLAVVLSPCQAARRSNEPGPRSSGRATSIFHPPRA